MGDCERIVGSIFFCNLIKWRLEWVSVGECQLEFSRKLFFSFLSLQKKKFQIESSFSLTPQSSFSFKKKKSLFPSKMAKSLRSKTKRAHRSLKRSSVFAQTEKERLDRLAQAQTLLVPFVDVRSPASLGDSQTDLPTQDSMDVTPDSLTKAQKDALFLSRNQFKKKMRAKVSKTGTGKKKNRKW